LRAHEERGGENDGKQKGWQKVSANHGETYTTNARSFAGFDLSPRRFGK
jgi:hypothetical protein